MAKDGLPIRRTPVQSRWDSRRFRDRYLEGADLTAHRSFAAGCGALSGPTTAAASSNASEGAKKSQESAATAAAKKEPPKDIDKQDAEAVLDALERVEPTVQKDLARRRALKTGHRPTKDY